LLGTEVADVAGLIPKDSGHRGFLPSEIDLHIALAEVGSYPEPRQGDIESPCDRTLVGTEGVEDGCADRKRWGLDLFLAPSQAEQREQEKGQERRPRERRERPH
jgi:hypothetical protein